MYRCGEKKDESALQRGAKREKNGRRGRMRRRDAEADGGERKRIEKETIKRCIGRDELLAP
jgi:hypothetical protein